jgi:4-hydroxybenzoate polyprenyltransferase
LFRLVELKKMKSVLKCLRLLNNLSLDVVGGAIASSIFFSTVFKTPISILVLTLLGLSVWIIYTVDHLLDVKNSKPVIISDRHIFHQRNSKSIKLGLATALILTSFLVFQLPNTITYAGVVLATIIAAYIFFNKRLGASKELVAALFYCAGVCLPTLGFVETQLPLVYRLLITQFFITALTNLILFALMERDEDKANRFNSIATLKSIKQVNFLLVLLFLVSIGLFIFQLKLSMQWMPSGILFFMNLVLCLLFIFRNALFVRTHYRLIGDGIFLMPIVILFF